MATIAKSIPSYLSKFKLWVSYCAFTGSLALGPTEAAVLRYVALFRNGRSAEGYVSAVRWLHDWARVPVSGWDTRALQQVLRGAVKLSAPTKKAPPITWRIVRRMASRATSRGDHDFSLICVMAAVFMLRVPDELLPLCFSDLRQHSALTVVDPHGSAPILLLELRSRKNASEGAALRRACACPRDPVMCAPHAFMRWVVRTSRPAYGRLFQMGPTSFTRILRGYLRLLEVPSPDTFSSHGFRRGTAQELLAKNAPLSHILRAGGWRSAAFLEYLEREDVDELAILQVMCDEDDEESGQGAALASSPSLAAGRPSTPPRGVRQVDPIVGAPAPAKRAKAAVPYSYRSMEEFFPAP